MRCARRALVPVFAATVAVSVTAGLPQFVSAQAPAAAEKDAAPPATDLAASPAETVDPKPLIEKGESALKAGDFATAMAAFSEAGGAARQALTRGEVGENQSNQRYLAAAAIGRGRAQMGLRDFEAAEKDFRSLLQEDPTFVPALVGLGDLKLETGKPDEALDQFQNAIKTDSTNMPALFGFGKALSQLGRGDEAISPLTRVIAADPKNAEAYRLRGWANASLFKTKQAIEDIQKSIEINPDDYESYLNLGAVYLRGENYQAAADEIGKAIEHYKAKPGHEDEPFFQGHLTRASVFIELGKTLKKDSPEQKAAYQASYDETEKLIKQLDEKNPAQVRAMAAALFARGVAERMLGQLGAAIRTFTHAMELRTSSAADESTAAFLTDAYYRRGICFHMIGEEKMAISDFESAAHLDTSDPRANLWEGFTYAKLGDYQQALRAYGDAIAASDRFTPAYYNRGLSYMMMGNYKKAIADFNDAIRLEPANPEYYFKRGLAYEAAGDEKKASESFSAAIEFDKNHAGAHRHMADALQKLGRSELANQYREKADQLAPPKKDK